MNVSWKPKSYRCVARAEPSRTYFQSETEALIYMKIKETGRLFVIRSQVRAGSRGKGGGHDITGLRSWQGFPQS